MAREFLKNILVSPPVVILLVCCVYLVTPVVVISSGSNKLNDTNISPRNWYKHIPTRPVIGIKLGSDKNNAPGREYSEESRFIGKLNPPVKHIDSETTVQPSYTLEPDYFSNDIDAVLEDPPPHRQVAKMARYIVAKSNWTAMATISSRSPTIGSPFANVFSVSDGPLGNNTGIPYMYLTPLEISVKDLGKNPNASLTMSLAQGHYCAVHQYDPEDPRCAHLILTGKVTKISADSDEGKFAKAALFSRHPAMPGWPKHHGWFFAKLEISNIMVLDYFGGAKTVSLDNYYSANV